MSSIGQELGVVADRRVGNLESPVARAERDRDSPHCPVFADNFKTPHHGIERRETLLAVDDQCGRPESWSLRSESAGVFVVGRVPEDECPDWEPYKERVEEIAHLCVFPDERPLQVRQGDHATLDVLHQRRNRPLTGFEDRRPPAKTWLTRGARIVFVRRIIELLGLRRLDNRLWLRQLATDDAGDVDDRFGQVIFEADRPADARHGHVNEAVEFIPQQLLSIRRMLDGERE